MPLPAFVCSLLAVAVVSAGITAFVMMPQIVSARKKAEEARTAATQAEARAEKLSLELTEAKRGTEETGEEGVEDPWVPSGRFSSGDEILDSEVKAFCDLRSDTSMKQEDAALEVFKGVAWSDYIERDDAQNPAGPNWRIEYARKYYEHDCTGNCYEFAAFLMYCMRYLGYEDAHAEGVVLEFASGDWGSHGLVFLTNTDGKACLLDTSPGVNGWMLSAGAYNYTLKDFDSL